ncbi:MAG: amino acid/amide transporter substrate-binding protein family, partial [Actinomycetia bacterium]|nr:amino acid/amide transporter substrate-binding protein family [Actinomycetes bacterium]
MFPYEVAASEGIGRMARIVERFGRAGAVFLTGAVLLGACSTTSGPSTGSGKPLTIGISMSLSGDFADFADPAKKGYELWAATVNAKGGLHGRKVVLKIADDASNPTQVVTNYQNLI